MADCFRRRRLLRPAALLLLLALLLCLSACGDPDPACGRWLCTGARTRGLTLEFAPGGEPTLLLLSQDGRGRLRRGGTEGTLSWSRTDEGLELNVGGSRYAAELTEGCLYLYLEQDLILRFEPEDQVDPGETSARWEWYGWWAVEHSEGEMPEVWRDCCARLEDGPYGPVLRVWDEQSSCAEPLVQLQMRWEDGAAVSESGWFLLNPAGEGDWRIDPAAAELELSGCCQTDRERFDFRFHLRPWGAHWEGEELHPPFHYRDWYLPLADAGLPMPDSIGF